jgi:hypothetical protein
VEAHFGVCSCESAKRQERPGSLHFEQIRDRKFGTLGVESRVARHHNSRICESEKR